MFVEEVAGASDDDAAGLFRGQLLPIECESKLVLDLGLVVVELVIELLVVIDVDLGRDPLEPRMNREGDVGLR